MAIGAASIFGTAKAVEAGVDVVEEAFEETPESEIPKLDFDPFIAELEGEAGRLRETRQRLFSETEGLAERRGGRARIASQNQLSSLGLAGTSAGIGISTQSELDARRSAQIESFQRDLQISGALQQNILTRTGLEQGQVTFAEAQRQFEESQDAAAFSELASGLGSLAGIGVSAATGVPVGGFAGGGGGGQRFASNIQPTQVQQQPQSFAFNQPRQGFDPFAFNVG